MIEIREVEFHVLVRKSGETPSVVFAGGISNLKAVVEPRLVLPAGFESLTEVFEFFRDYNIEQIGSGNTASGDRKVAFRIYYTFTPLTVDKILGL